MIYAFENFEIDTELYELRKNGSTLRLEPQVFDVLLFLVENRDRVVSKEDLFNQIWKGRIVTDSALASRLKAVRSALGDSGSKQRLIKTVHGRGFRFVGEVTVSDDKEGGTPPRRATVPDRLPIKRTWKGAPPGREEHLAMLLDSLGNTRSGARQTILISGEAGVGKTTLIRSFVDALSDDDSMYVAHGQCLEHHGAGEAYMPVLEAVARLCNEDETGAVVETMSRQAPTWVEQIPGLGEHGNDGAKFHLRGGTQDRMLREMVAALEALASSQPLVLILEDIHWSDPSTIDLLVRLAGRTDATRLMVVASFRSADFKSRPDSLYASVSTLQVRDQAREIALDVLDESSVAQFLAGRFGQGHFPLPLVPLLRQRTGGHPLFMHNVIEHWLKDGLLVEHSGTWQLSVDESELTRRIPKNLGLFIEHFIDALDAGDRALLEAAAIRGIEFTTVETSAVLQESESVVESNCSRLARQGRWIRASGVEEWPGGGAASKFSFIHDLYQEVMYGLVPMTRRVSAHRTIGEALESAYGHEAPKNAVELANHFSLGGVPEKAIGYLRLSARNALRSVAPREAIDAIRKALALVPKLANGKERARQELALQLTLAPPLIAIEGVGSKGAEAAYQRARELSNQRKEKSILQQVLYGMGAMYEVRGDFKRSQSLMEERIHLSSSKDEQMLMLESQELLACSLFHQGQFDQSLEHALAAMAQFDQTRHSIMAPAYGENPGISCRFWAALNLWFKGDVERSIGYMEEGIELSRHPDQVYALTNAYTQAATLCQLMRDPKGTLEWSLRAEETGKEQGYALRVAAGRILQGWARAMAGNDDEGIDLLVQGIDDATRTGACMDRPYFKGLLAEALNRAGRFEEGLAVVDSALSDTEDRTHFFFAAELHRLRGLLLMAIGDAAAEGEAEAAFRRAVSLATEQKARSMELRATTTLGGFLRDRDERAQAREMVNRALTSFKTDVSTPDLADAHALIQSL